MLLYGATIFLSAFLLFLIQPLIGKYILPWFGGSPAVWTACMLFFQALLLAGYGYAHALASRFRLRRQAMVHLVFVIAAAIVVLAFSILPGQSWKPGDDASPVLNILGLLLVSIGTPYFLLSATSPLLQSWFSRTRPDSSPYRLYALSNLGSLLAIVGYPLLIEPAIRVTRQASIWSWAFAVFALLCVLLCRGITRNAADSDPRQAGAVEPDAEKDRPGASLYILWLSLTACSSIMLLATTSQLCQDLAVVPLLWILPLALYLLSFIICFQHERLYWRPLFLPGLAASIIWTCSVLSGGVVVSLRGQILSYSLTLFVSCMICHGELVRLKPGARHLTRFYLTVAGGGGLGALLVTAVATHLFKGYWEYHFGVLATALLALTVLFRERKGLLFHGRPLYVWLLWFALCAAWVILAPKLVDGIWKTRRFQIGLAALVLLSVAAFFYDRKGRLCWQRPLRVWMVWALLWGSWIPLALVLREQIMLTMDSTVEARRNFFGVLRVLDLYSGYPGQHTLSLMHGRIEHGFQFQDGEKRFWPVSYYGPSSGVGFAISCHPQRLARGPLRMGVIGLGTGTLAVYGQSGDYIRFYEINPQVVELSDRYFTYRKDSKARIDVKLGDARISLDRERQRGESQKFDILVVDAFSSDAIPVHLLTRECFQIYRYHLKEDGILAVHITNRFFNLKPVVRSLLPAGAMRALWVDDQGNTTQGTDRTSWVLLTANAQFLKDPVVTSHVKPWEEPVPSRKLWTDDYSNLISVIQERKQ